MPDKFNILVSDLKRLREAGNIGVFGEESHSYETNSPLPEQEVLEFETLHHVRLPDDYRQFLLRVGNGGAGPCYGVFKLGEIDDGFDYGPWDGFIGELAEPFPHTDAWNDLTGQPEHSSDGDEERYESLLEIFEKCYWATQQVNGAIPICHRGCALRFWLVITGSESGNVWCDDRADCKGIYPLKTKGRERVGFFEWYRDWLDEALVKLKLWEKGTSG